MRSKNNRVVVTGIGVLSCLGNTLQEVTRHLKSGTSGISFIPEWQRLGFRSQIGGEIEDFDPSMDKVSKKQKLSMSDVALYCSLAAIKAVEDAGLGKDQLKQQSTGCLVGSGFTSAPVIHDCFNKLDQGKPNRVNPYTVVKSMSSTVSANIANVLSIGGRSYSISSACSTASHNIGHAFELIKEGLLDRAVAGGGDALGSGMAVGFNAMRLALSSNFNDSPERASRPYDKDRDGFVLSEGAGVIVIENLKTARQRDTHIYAEILGYAANSDGYDMVLPQTQGMAAGECMIEAIRSAKLNVNDIDYINTHGTSTLAGDLAESEAIRRIFDKTVPPFSSTKSMGGHTIGASGGIELIHCIAMLEDAFMAPSINIENLDPAFEGLPIVTELQDRPLSIILSNSFGFGGTNACLVIGKFSN